MHRQRSSAEFLDPERYLSLREAAAGLKQIIRRYQLGAAGSVEEAVDISHGHHTPYLIHLRAQELPQLRATRAVEFGSNHSRAYQNSWLKALGLAAERVETYLSPTCGLASPLCPSCTDVLSYKHPASTAKVLELEHTQLTGATNDFEAQLILDYLGKS